MKPLPDLAPATGERDPFAAQADRTPEELTAIRMLAGQLDALLDAPPPRPLPRVDDEDDDLAITHDALPVLGTTQENSVSTDTDVVDGATPSRLLLETGLADRMRGVLRGVLLRARRNRSAR